MSEFEIREAQSRLPELVERAVSGERIVLTRDGDPAVRIEPLIPTNNFARLRGVWTGQVEILDDEFEIDWG